MAFVDFGDDAAGLSIVLLLSRDSDPDVRALACRASLVAGGQVRMRTRPWFGRTWSNCCQKAVVNLRWVSCLGSSKAWTQESTLRGSSGRGWVCSQIEHPSWAVRTMATRLEERWVDQSD